MSLSLSSAVTRVWLALVVATGMTAVIFEAERDVAWATTAIIAIAGVKVALILSYFMEVRSAPQRLKVACGMWLVAVLAIVLTGFALD